MLMTVVEIEAIWAAVRLDMATVFWPLDALIERVRAQTIKIQFLNGLVNH